MFGTPGSAKGLRAPNQLFHLICPGCSYRLQIFGSQLDQKLTFSGRKWKLTFSGPIKTTLDVSERRKKKCDFWFSKVQLNISGGKCSSLKTILEIMLELTFSDNVFAPALLSAC